VALVFYWSELERQVRIEGQLEQLDAATADRYFYSRARESQLATWLARQSDVIEGRDILEVSLLQRLAEYDGKPIPRPPYYLAYRVQAAMVEFWQARTDRINDRLRYTHTADGAWAIELLAP
jgi:pyridoxamine 5'-phosphate oxidase